MKVWILLGLLLVAAIAIAEEAAECDIEACNLPECRCSGTDIPGGLSPRDTPQFVTVTFDDAVTVTSIGHYQSLLFNRNNMNGCPAGATFYVSHEYTSYQAINLLYNAGFEIALHSVSHKTDQNYWRDATHEDMEKEFVQQKLLMSHFANIPYEAMKGIRLPFIQMNGDTSFEMMAQNDFLYDCSWPTTAFRDPGLWPYTLHYRSTQDCIVPPCPTSSIPGPWVMPMVTWHDLNGIPCSFVDACINVPSTQGAGAEDEWFRFFVTNFERHYLGTRAPFGFYAHPGFITHPDADAVVRALTRFLDMLNNMDDVFMVNSEEVIQWVRNPVPIDEYKQQPCRTHIPTSCRTTFCGPVNGAHPDISHKQYWMQLCNLCPRVYPWLDNPLGI